FIDHRRGRGEAVVLVLAVLLAGKLPRPQALAVVGPQTQERPLAGLLLGTGDEEPFAPEHRRRVANARQLDLPGVVLLGPAKGDGGGVAEPRAVRSAEARPLLGQSRTGRGEPKKTTENGCLPGAHEPSLQGTMNYSNTSVPNF